MFPNPQTEYKKCHLDGPGYICDPDGLMNRTEVSEINILLQNFTEQTPRTCFNGKSYENYVMSVAFLDKLSAKYAVIKDVQIFGHDLRALFWTFGK